MDFSEQFVIYYVGLLPSEFYRVFGEKDWDGFKRHTVYSIILIVSIAFVSCFSTVHFEPVLIIHECVLYIIASSFKTNKFTLASVIIMLIPRAYHF